MLRTPVFRSIACRSPYTLHASVFIIDHKSYSKTVKLVSASQDVFYYSYTVILSTIINTLYISQSDKCYTSQWRKSKCLRGDGGDSKITLRTLPGSNYNLKFNKTTTYINTVLEGGLSPKSSPR